MTLSQKQIDDILKYKPLVGATIGRRFQNYAESGGRWYVSLCRFFTP
jgi:hypothetical protein